MTEQPGDDAGTTADDVDDLDEEHDVDSAADHDGDAPPAPTGVRAADDARARLSDVDEAPLESHVEVYEDVHRQLHEGLADLDES
jgi:hypothetical protein